MSENATAGRQDDGSCHGEPGVTSCTQEEGFPDTAKVKISGGGELSCIVKVETDRMEP